MRALFLVCLLVAGCSGPSASPSASPGTTPPATGGGQWQVALAALDRWNDLIARSWPAVRGMIDARLEVELRKALASVGWDDPLKQHPGIDLILPYWIARSYGLIRP